MYDHRRSGGAYLHNSNRLKGGESPAQSHSPASWHENARGGLVSPQETALAGKVNTNTVAFSFFKTADNIHQKRLAKESDTKRD